MMVIEAMISRPRIQRFWIRCPAPGMNHATAGAMTDMLGRAGAAVFCASAGVVLDEFAIQMITSSLWILPVTCAALGLISMFTSLRTPNSGK